MGARIMQNILKEKALILYKLIYLPKYCIPNFTCYELGKYRLLLLIHNLNTAKITFTRLLGLKNGLDFNKAGHDSGR